MRTQKANIWQIVLSKAVKWETTPGAVGISVPEMEYQEFATIHKILILHFSLTYAHIEQFCVNLWQEKYI